MTGPQTTPSRLKAAERQKRALELRKAGVSYDRIATELGYSDGSGAYRAVKAGLKKTLQEPAADLRSLELARLDELLMGLWSEARKGNHLKVDRVLLIMQRRAELLGLDAPKPEQPITLKGDGSAPLEVLIRRIDATKPPDVPDV